MTIVRVTQALNTEATPYDVAEHLRTPDEMAAYLKHGFRKHLTMLREFPARFPISPEPRVCRWWPKTCG